MIKINGFDYIGNELDAHVEELGEWNIKAAGRNEVIAAEIDRNWLELEKLGWKRNDRSE